MTGILRWGFLVGSLAQNLVDVPETTTLRSCVDRSDLFQD